MRPAAKEKPGPEAPAPSPLLERLDAGIALALAAAALALYSLTICPGLYAGDSAEFAVVCPLLDITHPTGYPLLTLLGKLFSLLPFGNVAWRVNLLGATAAAAAASLLYLDARLIGLQRPFAAFGAVLFALSRELWENSTAVEVYSLHAALTAAVLLAALRFRQSPSAPGLATAAGVLGLSFTNHLTTLWTVPCAAWLMLGDWRPWSPRAKRGAPQRWRPSRRELAVAGAAFLGAVSLYAYVPIRSLQGPLFDQGEPRTIGSFLHHLTGKQFQYRMFVQPDTGLAKEVSSFLERLSVQFTPWLLPLPIVGAYSLWRRDRSVSAGLALLAAANLAFDLNYHIPDKQGYFLPVYLVVALLAAEGLSKLAALARPGAGGRGIPAPSVTVLSVLLLLVPLFSNYKEVDESGNRSFPEFTAELLRRVPADGLLLVDDELLVWSTSYEQLLCGNLGDRIVVNDYLLCLPWYIHHLRRRWPQLVLPPQVDEMVADRDREVGKAQGWQIGDISQKYTERIARAIILANLPRRRVYWNFHDSEERKEWKGLPLVNRGLFYEVFASAPAPQQTPWPIDYPDPARYRKDQIRDSHWRHVADTFSVSCNRNGIALIAAGNYAEAAAAFQRSLAYNPEYPQVHLNMGVLYDQYSPDLKKRDEHWGRFVEMVPKDPQADTVRQALGKKTR